VTRKGGSGDNNRLEMTQKLQSEQPLVTTFSCFIKPGPIY